MIVLNWLDHINHGEFHDFFPDFLQEENIEEYNSLKYLYDIFFVCESHLRGVHRIWSRLCVLSTQGDLKIK